MNNYHSLLICVLILVLYGLSYFLTKIKIINLLVHKKIWNIILLISFLISGIFGLMLVIFLDQRLAISWYRAMLWWHVEAGIVMAIVSIFHALWHWQYFWNLFKKNKKPAGDV